MLTRSVSMIGVYLLSMACTSSHEGTPVIPLDSGSGGLTPLPLPTGSGGTGGNGTGGHGGATDASVSDAHTHTEGGMGLDGSLRDSGSTGGAQSADALPPKPDSAALEPCANVGAQRCATDVEICVGTPSVWAPEGCNFGCEVKDAAQPSCLCTAPNGRYVVSGGAGPYREVKDTVTGLTWGSDGGSGTVAEAIAACPSGSRLPSAAEIEATLVQKTLGPASAGCSVNFDSTLYPSVPTTPASPGDATFWISDMVVVNHCAWDLFGGVVCPSNPAQVFRYRCVK